MLCAAAEAHVHGGHIHRQAAGVDEVEYVLETGVDVEAPGNGAGNGHTADEKFVRAREYLHGDDARPLGDTVELDSRAGRDAGHVGTVIATGDRKWTVNTRPRPRLHV